MPDPLEPGGASGPVLAPKLVTRRVRVRRPLGLGFGLSVLLSVAVVTALTILTRGGAIESTLRDEVTAALDGADLSEVGVSVAGRVVTVEVPPGADEAAATTAAEGVRGVSAVEVEKVFASAGQARACEKLQPRLDKATDKRRIPFAGAAVQPTPEGVAMLEAAAEVLKECPTGTVLVGGHTDSDTDNGPTISLDRARAMVRILKQNGVQGSRLAPRGYGDQLPVTDGETAADRMRNQRGSLVLEGQG